jgi:hypothetical protein
MSSYRVGGLTDCPIMPRIRVARVLGKASHQSRRRRYQFRQFLGAIHCPRTGVYWSKTRSRIANTTNSNRTVDYEPCGAKKSAVIGHPSRSTRLEPSGAITGATACSNPTCSSRGINWYCSTSTRSIEWIRRTNVARSTAPNTTCRVNGTTKPTSETLAPVRTARRRHLRRNHPSQRVVGIVHLLAIQRIVCPRNLPIIRTRRVYILQIHPGQPRTARLPQNHPRPVAKRAVLRVISSPARPVLHRLHLAARPILCILNPYGARPRLRQSGRSPHRIQRIRKRSVPRHAALRVVSETHARPRRIRAIIISRPVPEVRVIDGIALRGDQTTARLTPVLRDRRPVRTRPRHADTEITKQTQSAPASETQSPETPSAPANPARNTNAAAAETLHPSTAAIQAKNPPHAHKLAASLITRQSTSRPSLIP